MKRLVAIIVLTLIAAPAARAQWTASASPADVFGNRTVLASATAKSGDGLIIQCNQNDSLMLAYVFPATPKDLDQIATTGGVPVQLLLKVDGGKIMRFQATMQGWNNHYAGFVVSGRNYPLVEAIKAIGGAQDSIGVGAESPGGQDSDNFGPEGSTAAMATVVKDCKLGNIKPTQSTSNTDQNSGD